MDRRLARKSCVGVWACGCIAGIMLPTKVCADVKVERMTYHGWPGSYRITNGIVELVFVPQIGRIMRYAFVGGKNVLWENSALFGKTVDPKNPGKDWVNFGGDKLWPAPQSRWNWPPDPILDSGSQTVHLKAGHILRVTGQASRVSGIRLSREIALDPTGTKVTIQNEMRNSSDHDVAWSIWEVAQVHDPDRAIMPLYHGQFQRGYHQFKGDEPAKSQLKLRDGLLSFTRDLRKGAKIGCASPAGWLASEGGGLRFKVSAKYPLRGRYPDDGCAQEIWSNPDPLKYMELELLSPIVTLKPGKSYTFQTVWSLKRIR